MIPGFKGAFSNANRATANANTAITVLVNPAMRGAKTRITNINYTNGNTTHLITVLKALARVSTTAANASANTITLSSMAFRGDTLAGSDYVVVEHSDGSYGAYSVSSVNTTTLVATLASNLTVAVASGAKVWIMGATGEAEHKTMLAPVSSLSRFESALAGIVTSGYRSVSGGTVYQRSGNDDPLLVHSNNGTAAGVIEVVSGYYGTV